MRAVMLRTVGRQRATWTLLCMAIAAGSSSAGAQRLAPPAGPAYQVDPGRGTPPLEPARIAGQVLAGAYAGIGGYFIASWAGGFVTDRLTDASEGTRADIQFTIGILGAAAATAGSVWAVGDIGDQTGSYGAALGGTAGGIATAFLLNKILYGRARLPTESGSSRLRWVEASLEALLPSIGATIAINSTRRYK
jgi:hypothetical protein